MISINFKEVSLGKQLISSYSFNSAIDLPPPIFEESTNDNEVITVLIKKGHTLFDILKKHQIDIAILQRLTRNKYGKVLNYLQKDETMQLYLKDKQLVKLDYRPNSLKLYRFERNRNNRFNSQKIIETPDKSIGFKSFSVHYSLYQSATKAGLPKNLVIELANIYAWDIDFVNDIRFDDKITVAYEKLFKNGEFIGYGNIKAAKIINRGKVYYALRHNRGGRSEYFDQYGNNLKKAFLRNPLEFKYVSSHFNPNRKHPILNKIRAHNGTDYAANRNTPVRATGDGKVVMAKWHNGYGRMVKIQHGNLYETRYAHLNKFGSNIRKGKTIKQGDIIGYVGKTGLATGYHLHYEFLKRNKHQNPVTVNLPRANSISRKENQDFIRSTRNLVELLNYSQRSYTIASASVDKSNQDLIKN